MTAPLPRRPGADSGDRWAWFVAVAGQSASAVDLLCSVLGRRIIVHPLRHHELTPRVPPAQLRMRSTDGPLALDEHLLIDSDPPHPTVGVTSALVVPSRLPGGVGRWFEQHEMPVAALLAASAAFWSSETLQVEHVVVGEASFPSPRAPDTPMVRLTRRVSVVDVPVAIVLDEIPLPDRRAERPAPNSEEDPR